MRKIFFFVFLTLVFNLVAAEYDFELTASILLKKSGQPKIRKL